MGESAACRVPKAKENSYCGVYALRGVFAILWVIRNWVISSSNSNLDEFTLLKVVENFTVAFERVNFAIN